jgi:hypothetical protein
MNLRAAGWQKPPSNNLHCSFSSRSKKDRGKACSGRAFDEPRFVFRGHHRLTGKLKKGALLTGNGLEVSQALAVL